MRRPYSTVIVAGALLLCPGAVSGSTAQFSGVWRNVDPNTYSLTTLQIETHGTSVQVHAWGRCHPEDCDWGTVDGAPYAAHASNDVAQSADVLSAMYATDYVRRLLVIRLLGENALSVESFTEFTDERRNQSYRMLDTFVRASTDSGGDRTPPPQRAMPRSTTILRWDFDAPNAHAIATDSSGHGRDGRVVAAVPAQGRFGPGLQFSGGPVGSQYVVLDSAMLPTPAVITIDLWIKPSRLDINNQMVVHKYENNVPSNSDYILLLDNNRLVFGTRGSETLGAVLDAPDQWYHVTAIANGSKSELWVNQVLRASGFLADIPHGTRPLVIGSCLRSCAPNNRTFAGVLDEVVISDGVRRPLYQEPTERGSATVARETHRGTLQLKGEDSYDFVSGTMSRLLGGDFYLLFSPRSNCPDCPARIEPSFWSNNVGQHGVIDLGDVGKGPLANVSPPDY